MSFESQALVLRTIDYGEADLIVSLLSQKQGRITAFVPGARHSKKRFANALDQGCLFSGDFRVRKGSALLALKSFEYIDVATYLRDSPEAAIRLGCFAEAILKLTPEHDPMPDLFTLFRDFRLVLTDQTPSSILLPVFELKLLRLHGLLGQFECCNLTGEKLSKAPRDRKYLLSAEHGGIVAAHAAKQLVSGPQTTFDLGTVKALASLMNGTIALNRLKMSTKVVTDLHHAVADLIEFHSGTELRGRRLYHHILAQPGRNYERPRKPTSGRTQPTR